jgi:hypothetical protein
LIKNAVRSYDTYERFFYFGTDGSIDVNWGDHEEGYRGVELVSQPLPYSWLSKEIDIIWKKHPWKSNDTCGIHIHVSKSGVSLTRLKILANKLIMLTRLEFLDLFGRRPNHYCCNAGYSTSDRYCAINFTNSKTIEFRMFASGDAVWAKECLRRVKLMCEYKGDVTYSKLLELFTNP